MKLRSRRTTYTDKKGIYHIKYTLTLELTKINNIKNVK